MLHDQRARRVAIIGSARIPFCRSHGAYRSCSNQDMMTAALSGLVNKFDLKGETLGDVALGAVIKHSKDFNLARESVIGSGLSLHTPGVDLQRACGTSLEAAFMIGNKIALGQIDAGIAGGTDTISDAPIVYNDDYRRMLLDMHAAHSAMDRLKPLLRFRPDAVLSFGLSGGTDELCPPLRGSAERGQRGRRVAPGRGRAHGRARRGLVIPPILREHAVLVG